jgi:hypothetical protein
MAKGAVWRDEIAQQRCVLCGAILQPHDGNNPYPLAEHGIAAGSAMQGHSGKDKALIGGAADDTATSH